MKVSELNLYKKHIEMHRNKYQNIIEINIKMNRTFSLLILIAYMDEHQIKLK